MKYLIRNRNFYLILAGDISFIIIAFIAAHMLRFEGNIPAEYWAGLKKMLPVIVIVKVGVFFIFKLYAGMWRYASLVDLFNVVKASVSSSLIIILFVLFLYRFEGYSRSVFLIDWILTLFLIGGIRAGIRIVLSNNLRSFFSFRDSGDCKRMIIVGAGGAGEKVLREIHDNPGLNYNVIGFLDDDPYKRGKAIHGVPVLGTPGQVQQFKSYFDEVLIAIPSARGEVIRKIVSACERIGKRVRIIPNMGELIGGKLSLKAIRNITLEDLLGRDEIYLEQDKIDSYLKDKRVLVTGAGGSIGSELVRQIGRFKPQALGLVEFSEYNLFQIEMEIRQKLGTVSVEGFLADIRNSRSVRRVFDSFQPDVVFHAAAYKHVPLQEITPWEAVVNNVLGTRNLVDAAIASNVKKFVLVSTDKAVRPSNVMGATKRIAEMLIQTANGNGTSFIAVRFGNVIGSSGSAIPVFQKQIAQGGPVTVTHPDIQRYFMSIPEAAQLILQAGAMGEGGEIFILDMGKPVRILDMARELIRLHGLEPDKDIPIKFIGLRPGEKLYEELITKGEGIVETYHEKIVVLRGRYGNPGNLKTRVDELLELSVKCDARLIRDKLKEIVPEYNPQP
ncbi:MAG: nucleoside-diphosphate sugar epimerase/dehydratase [Syntrophaceae bacterium]